MGNMTQRVMQHQQDMRDRRLKEERARQPYDTWPTDVDAWPPFPFPTFHGDYVSLTDWDLATIHYVNFSEDGHLLPAIYGLGSSVEEFKELVIPGRGYAFTTLGQIAEYTLKKEKP